MKLAWKNGWAIFVRLRSFSLTIGIIILFFTVLGLYVYPFGSRG